KVCYAGPTQPVTSRTSPAAPAGRRSPGHCVRLCPKVHLFAAHRDPRGETSMMTNLLYEREASRRLLAEAKAQRSRELHAPAGDLQDAVRWNAVALACAACLVIVGVAACAG